MAGLQLHSTTLFDSLHASFSRLHFPRLLLPLRRCRRCRFSSSATFPSRNPYPNRDPCDKTLPSLKSDHQSAPWIKNWTEPRFRSLPKKPRAALDYRQSVSSDDDEYGTSRSTGSSAMAKIVEKLRKFGYIDDSEEVKERPLPEKGSVEDIFYAEDGILPDSRGGLSWDVNEKARFPWEKPREEEEKQASARKTRSKTSLAELTLPEGELRRLRHLAIRTKSKTKIGGAGVTKEIVDLIHEKWKTEEVVRLKCEGPPALNMKRMHEILEKLTGGAILSRNKDYIVFYRGKDFLSPEVTEALLERERLAKALQDEEEQARLRASSSVASDVDSFDESGTAGTLNETLEAAARWGNNIGDDHMDKMMRAAEMARHAGLVKKLERKLFIAERKLTKAGKALAKVEESLKPTEHVKDPEAITDEERFMFRKLGLRMKAFLLLGRRGVFDGTIENMHLHWKYRELVKIIVKAKTFAQVQNVALALEAESGGVLVSVDKISKGFAIIVYRGKDYHRPPTLRPKNLLTKRKALARSIELQRREALNRHISNVQKKVEQLRSELVHLDNVKDHGDEELYANLDSAYSTEDEEDSEDEGDEAYLDTFNGAVAIDRDDGDAHNHNDDDDYTEESEADGTSNKDEHDSYFDGWINAVDISSDEHGGAQSHYKEDNDSDEDSEIDDYSEDDENDSEHSLRSSTSSANNQQSGLALPVADNMCI